MKYIEKTHIRTHIYTHIRIYARGSSTVYCLHHKNTRKGIHEMTINDITILAILAAWLIFIKWVMR